MTKKKHNPISHKSVPHSIQPKSRKRTTIKVIVLATMFFLLFSTIGATVIYLGNNPAVPPTQVQPYATGAFLSGGQPPKDDIVIPGLGALSGDNTAKSNTGDNVPAATGSNTTGSNTSGAILSGN